MKIAGAPISWGVCEVPDWGYQMAPERVLAEMQQIGLTATEFGPQGWLPVDAEERAPSEPTQTRLPFDDFAEPQGAPGPRALKRYPRLRLDDLIPVVDTNLFGVQVDARVPEAQRKVVNHLLEMGLPTAVFIAPAGVTS